MAMGMLSWKPTPAYLPASTRNHLASSEDNAPLNTDSDDDRTCPNRTLRHAFEVHSHPARSVQASDTALPHVALFALALVLMLALVSVSVHVASAKSLRGPAALLPDRRGVVQESEEKAEDSSCAHYGCVEFDPSHSCQCNFYCSKHHSCCSDYKDMCSVEVDGPVNAKPFLEHSLSPFNLQAHSTDATTQDESLTQEEEAAEEEEEEDDGYDGDATEQDREEVYDESLGQKEPEQETFHHYVSTQAPERAFRKADCHTAVEGEPCYDAVMWAMTTGLRTHPEWYPGLHEASHFNAFQRRLHRNNEKRSGNVRCPKPCSIAEDLLALDPLTLAPTTAAPVTQAPTTRATTTPAAPRPRPTSEPAVAPHAPAANSSALTCLCAFDVDRTLTAKQGEASGCPGTKTIEGVRDTAYGGGTLVISELGQHIAETFCGKCYRGVVSHGDASGAFSKERDVILDLLGGVQWTLSDHWSISPNVESTLVVSAPDKFKQDSVRDVLAWLQKAKGVTIQDNQVFFFDDNDLNPPPFRRTSFNARQISCASREGMVGLCGGRLAEVSKKAGVQTCDGLAPAPTPATTTPATTPALDPVVEPKPVPASGLLPAGGTDDSAAGRGGAPCLEVDCFMEKDDGLLQ